VESGSQAKKMLFTNATLGPERATSGAVSFGVFVVSPRSLINEFRIYHLGVADSAASKTIYQMRASINQRVTDNELTNCLS
jgi:hypothetical protein